MKSDDELAIIYWECPYCGKVTENITYMRSQNKWLITLGMICLAMDCDQTYTVKFIRPTLKQIPPKQIGGKKK